MEKKTVIQLLLVVYPLLIFSQNIVPGIPIAHSPKSTGVYLGTPSIVIMPDGTYLMSHDLFGPGCRYDGETVFLYASSNKGETWESISFIHDAFWAGLFLLKDKVYLLGVQATTKNLAIWESTDGGFTWSDAHRLRTGSFHGSSTPVVYHNGRVYKGYENLGFEDRKKPWMVDNKSFIMSADIKSNLLDSTSWIISESISKPKEIDGTGWLETNAVLGQDGSIKGITRIANESGFLAGFYSLKNDSTIDDNSIGSIDFIGGATKFNIMWDPKTKKYWSLTNYPPEILRTPKMRAGGMRSVLSLISSEDLKNWVLNAIVLASENVKHHGFQYVDWKFDGKDIIFVSRTGYDDEFGGSDNFHNSNYITFHRIKNYKQAKTSEKYLYLLPDYENKKNKYKRTNK